MLELDVVDRCESAWSSPVLIVYKSNGQPRFCLDSRKLNSVTKRDAYNLPYVSEILDNLRDAKFLSSVDLSKAFWQIPIAPEDQEKTAFYVPGRGTLKFKTTAFGLTNAPATQQRLVDMLFGDFDLKTFAYLDDIIVVSSSFEEHVSLLLRVLEKLKHANLTINLEKCKFFRSQLKYLGYVVDEHGLRTDPSKVEAILNYPTPTSRKDLKRFLGTATWYRRFVPNFSTVAGPLNKLTSNKKNAPPFKWTPEADASFNKLKECLVSAPVLSCPNYDLPFEVHTDASDYGVGAMLTQTVDGKEHPIAYMSRSLTGAEKNYSITERETLAVITALEHWRCYLENGQTFTVYTDHSALKWFLSLTNPTGRLARWGVRLSSFNFEMKHRRGVDNVIPDALSRAVPCAAVSSNSHLDTKDTWAFTTICYSADGQFILGGGNSKHVCLYSARDAILVKKFVITQNRSLDAVSDVINRRLLSEFGNMALVEERADLEGGDVDIRLPGVRRGDMADRNTKPEVRVHCVRFSPTGDSFAAAATEGLLLYGQGAGLDGTFRPFRLEQGATPLAVSQALARREWGAALLPALQLNEPAPLARVLEAVPHTDVELTLSSLDAEYMDRLVEQLARQLEQSRHVEQLLRWARAVLSLRRVPATAAVRRLEKALTVKYEQLAKICDFNKYTMRCIRSAGAEACKSEDSDRESSGRGTASSDDDDDD
ncbi:unnamed protein product [Plutella xylostella]|uniref:RNA-directed DNA polymerase n=1 Tax=Plutella xylostella TaxID=51655 RepID=A0A8S4G2F3_PLUXY|nr:unnamed protein product [Plutella xylostella]